jgi:hypothetical protein
LPVALRARLSAPATGNQVLRCLVTMPISAGTTLGFRFFEPTNGYLSPYATTVTFATTGALSPGQVVDVVRLAPGSGTALVRTLYAAPCAAGTTDALGFTSTDLVDSVAGNSCFVFWRPARCAAPDVALAAIAGMGLGAGDAAYLPPPCVLPCQFIVKPSVPGGPNVDYVTVGPPAGSAPATGGAVPGTWRQAWQVVKFRAWVAGNDALPAPWSLADDFTSGLYTQPSPGALIPVATRPHLEGSAFPAQLVLVVTTPIAGGTTLQLSASPTVDPPAYWTWQAPLTPTALPAGTVLDFTGLGFGSGWMPSVNVGTVTSVATGGDDPGDLTEFTVFCNDPCGTGRANVTALYTCARPTGCELPPGLTAGLDMPAAPWPAPCASILPVQGVPPDAWPMAALALSRLAPVAWSWQPTPCFRTSKSCIDDPGRRAISCVSCGGVGGGSCCSCGIGGVGGGSCSGGYSSSSGNRSGGGWRL